ncbi:MAG: hypothetical protein ACO31Z_08740, partial [Litorivicinaceae bacterium]
MGSQIAARLGGAAAGLGVQQAEVALVYGKDGSGNSWLSSRGTIGQLTLGSYVFEQLQNAQWSINRAVSVGGVEATASAATLDWTEPRRLTLESGTSLLLDQSGDVFAVSVDGQLDLGEGHLSGAFALTYDRAADIFDLAFSEASWAMAAGGAFIRVNQAAGSLRLDAERRRIGSLTGAVEIGGLGPLSMDATATVAFNDLTGDVVVTVDGDLTVDGFATISGDFGVSRQFDAFGERLLLGAQNASAVIGPTGSQITVNDLELGLVLSRDATGQAGYALVAEGSAAVSLGGAITASAADAMIEINTLGRAVSEDINVGGTSPFALRLDEERAIQRLRILGASVSIADIGSLSGHLEITQVTEKVGAKTRDQLNIGISQASASLAVGPATLDITGGYAGLAVFTQTVDDTPTTRYALQAGGSASLSGLSGVSLSVSDVAVSVNRAGVAINTLVSTGAGFVEINQSKDYTAFTGAGALAIGDVFALEGTLVVESLRNQSVSTIQYGLDENNEIISVSAPAVVDTLVISGLDMAATVSAGADLAMSGVDVAVAYSVETSGTTPRRWLTTSATIDEASLSAGITAEIDYAMLEINRTLAADGSLGNPTDAVIDWSATPYAKVLGEEKQVVFESAVPLLTFALQGDVQVAGASLSGLVHVNAVTDGWKIAPMDAALRLKAGEAEASLSSLSGELTVTDAGVTGTISGVAAITGVDGVTANGAMTATVTDNSLSLAGDIELGLSGVGSLAGSFSVVKQNALLAVPMASIATATTGQASVSKDLVVGGDKTASQFRLTVSDPITGLAREGAYRFQFGGETQVASSLDASGRPLSDSAFAAAIQTALERISGLGVGNVTVSGDRASGFVIALANVLTGRAIDVATVAGGAGLWVEQPAEQTDREDWGVIEALSEPSPAINAKEQLILESGAFAGTLTLARGDITTAPITLAPAQPAMNARQVLTLSADARASGQFWVTLDGVATQKIRYSADPTYHTAQLKSAIEAVVGTGNVSVTYQTGYTGHNSIDYVIDFRGALAGESVSTLVGHSTSAGIRVSTQTVRQGQASVSLAYQAAQLEQALNASFGAGSARVALGAEATGGRRVFDITWTGSAGGQPQTLLTAVASDAGVTVSQRALVAGSAARGAVQAIRLYDGTTAGTFELYIQVGGDEYTTRQLSFDASAATVREAILASTNAAGEALLATGAAVDVELI